jgi:hypothetical protein
MDTMNAYDLHQRVSFLYVLQGNGVKTATRLFGTIMTVHDPVTELGNTTYDIATILGGDPTLIKGVNPDIMTPSDEALIMAQLEDVEPHEVPEMVALNKVLREFTQAIREKLLKNERKYQFNGAWKKDDWKSELQLEIRNHVVKGDPLDVAIYAMFAHYHGWPV